MNNKPSKYQEKVLKKLQHQTLRAPLSMSITRKWESLGLGDFRFPDNTRVSLETVMSLERKGLVYTRRVMERGTGHEEVVLASKGDVESYLRRHALIDACGARDGSWVPLSVAMIAAKHARDAKLDYLPPSWIKETN